MIPYPNFFYPRSEFFPSRILDPQQEFKSFNPQKKCSKIWFGLFIPDPDPEFLPIPDPGSRGQKGTGSRIRIRNTGPERTSTGYRFFIFYFDLEFLKRVQSSEPLNIKMLQSHHSSSSNGLYRILSSYWLARFNLMQKSAKVLHYFCLHCRMLEFFKFFSRSIIQKQLLALLLFWDLFGGKDCVLCPYNRLLIECKSMLLQFQT